MPAYWFMYNMYALARNAGKYHDRDNRYDKTQKIEYDVLAPDTVNEIFDALQLLKKFTGAAYQKKSKEKIPDKDLIKTGELLLENNKVNAQKLEVLAEGFENSSRKVQLVKPDQSYLVFKELITYYGIINLVAFIQKHNITDWKKLGQALPFRSRRSHWSNIGGQLMPDTAVQTLIKNIHTGKIKSWDEVHLFYRKNSSIYDEQKFQHAFASLLENLKLSHRTFGKKIFKELLLQTLVTKEWMVKGIYESRAKDYHSEFRKMVYETKEEMNKVLGKLEDNLFINQQKEELKLFRKTIAGIISKLGL
jgi:hypothetical protein